MKRCLGFKGGLPIPFSRDRRAANALRGVDYAADIPPRHGLLVAPQLMQPAQLLAAPFGARDERELQSLGLQYRIHGRKNSSQLYSHVYEVCTIFIDDVVLYLYSVLYISA